MHKKRVWVMALITVFTLLVSACGSKTETETPAVSAPAEISSSPAAAAETPAAPKDAIKIKVGLICGGMTPILAQIGMNDGSFEKAGLAVEKVCFTAGTDAVQALVGGSLDINLGSYEHVLRQQKNGLDVKAYAEIYNGVGYSLIVKNNDKYQKVADLKKTTLAVTKVGSLSDTGLHMGLSKEGLDPSKDVQIIGGGSGATMLAIIEGDKVAGGMVSEPTITQMITTGKYKILYEPSFDFAGITVTAKSDWVSKNKEAMQIFLKVLTEIDARAKQDPNTVVDAMLKEFPKVTKEVMQTAVKNQLAKVPAGLKVTEAAAKNVSDSQIELGAISKTIPFDKTVDLSLLPQ
jgi:NitT/TauT family transport system substrate-binding protein